jgi:hypothetical protein
MVGLFEDSTLAKGGSLILLGIVGGVSGATSERILGGLSDAGCPCRRLQER